jgi:TPR repeat protein
LLFAQDGPPPGRASLKERASKGDPEAQFNLAKNYETGRAGLKKDFLEAERWYRLAANQGDPFAQASLGILYRFGKGVPRDYVQAYMWFHLAANQTTGGDQQSIVELLESTESRMTREQVAEAVQKAKEFKPKPQ